MLLAYLDDDDNDDDEVSKSLFWNLIEYIDINTWTDTPVCKLLILNSVTA